MRPFHAPAVVAILLSCALSGALWSQEPFVYQRGDANATASVDISDAIYILNFLFLGGPAPACQAVADANASGELDISDPVALLTSLFVGGVTLPPLSEEEEQSCPRLSVLRSGHFQTEMHGVSGIAEQLENRTIRLRNFRYDGLGGIGVVVWLHSGGDVRNGYEISPDLRIGFPGYRDATLVFPIPEWITDDMFHSVAIWCKTFSLVFGNARLSYQNH
jgi:hypothetical protein